MGRISKVFRHRMNPRWNISRRDDVAYKFEKPWCAVVSGRCRVRVDVLETFDLVPFMPLQRFHLFQKAFSLFVIQILKPFLLYLQPLDKNSFLSLGGCT